MMSPHPPRLRMKRRKTVSVTPAMGARTVAGEIVTVPIGRVVGIGFWGRGWPFCGAGSSRAGVPMPHTSAHGLSQNLRIKLYSTFPLQTIDVLTQCAVSLGRRTDEC